jgi:hypothetical protein
MYKLITHNTLLTACVHSSWKFLEKHKFNVPETHKTEIIMKVNIKKFLTTQCYNKSLQGSVTDYNTLMTLFILSCTDAFVVVFIIQDFRKRKRTPEALALGRERQHGLQ